METLIKLIGEESSEAFKKTLQIITDVARVNLFCPKTIEDYDGVNPRGWITTGLVDMAAGAFIGDMISSPDENYVIAGAVFGGLYAFVAGFAGVAVVEGVNYLKDRYKNLKIESSNQ